MEQNHYNKTRQLILACMIILPGIMFLISLSIGYYYFGQSLETQTVERMKRIVSDHRHMIDSFLQERQADLEFIIDSYPFQHISCHENLNAVFLRLKQHSNAFADMGVFDEAGVHVAYIGPYQLTGKEYKDAAWFKEVLHQGVYISDVFLGYRKIPHFIIAITRKEAGRTWVLRAAIDTLVFNDLVEKVRIGKTGEAYLLNRDGIFQTERRSGGDLMGKDPDPFVHAAFESADAAPSDEGKDRLLVYPHKGKEIRTFIQADAGGNNYLYATTWMKDKDWLLVVRQEKADAFRALRTALFLIVIVALIGGAVIITVAFFLTERIIRRMELTDFEKRQLGDQLIRATRLAELGEMAAGFAHEINNPLQIMKSEQALMEAILTDLKESGELKPSKDLLELDDSIGQIALQIGRCSEITHAILKFGRKTDPNPRNVRLQDFIPEMVDMVAHKAQVNGIDFKQNISEKTRPIYGDPSQLQQVMLNLFNNAMDAIAQRHGADGGVLCVDIGNKDGDTVEVRVIDNGSGISPENLKRIFSPFFTTKPVGQGTGLGLSVCYGIIDSMGGVMAVDSRRNEGTTFSICLPAVDHDADGTAA